MFVRQRPLLRLILSRWMVISASLTLLTLLLGCLNVNIDRGVDGEGLCKQSGSVSVPAGEELDVFYPKPFATPPNLTVSSTFDECVVIAQLPDHFRVRNAGLFARNADWEVRGERIVPPDPLPGETVPAPGSPACPCRLPRSKVSVSAPFPRLKEEQPSWIALVESPHHVCCRYRLAAFRPLWEPHGYTLDLRPLPPRWWLRLIFTLNSRADRSSSAKLLGVGNQTAGKVALSCSTSTMPSSSAIPMQPRASMTRAGAAVSPPSSGPATPSSRATLFWPRQPFAMLTPAACMLIPTCVNPEHYVPLAEPVARGNVDLVWIGSSSTLQGLRKIAPILDELGRGLPELRLKLICDRFPRLYESAHRSLFVERGDRGG